MLPMEKPAEFAAAIAAFWRASASRVASS
jgi:hypothetical protein